MKGAKIKKINQINEIIEDKYLELYDEVTNDTNSLVLYYRKLKFQNKKFTLFTKKYEIEKYNNIYYCVLITVPQKLVKIKILKVSKNLFLYVIQKLNNDKINQKYIYCKGHSYEWDKIIKEKFMNFKELKDK